LLKKTEKLQMNEINKTFKVMLVGIS